MLLCNPQQRIELRKMIVVLGLRLQHSELVCKMQFAYYHRLWLDNTLLLGIVYIYRSYKIDNVHCSIVRRPVYILGLI